MEMSKLFNSNHCGKWFSSQKPFFSWKNGSKHYFSAICIPLSASLICCRGFFSIHRARTRIAKNRCNNNAPEKSIDKHGCSFDNSLFWNLGRRPERKSDFSPLTNKTDERASFVVLVVVWSNDWHSCPRCIWREEQRAEREKSVRYSRKKAKNKKKKRKNETTNRLLPPLHTIFGHTAKKSQTSPLE